MRIIDQNGKVLGKINIIDLALILLLLGAVAFAVVKFTKNDTLPILSEEKQEVTLTLWGNALHPFVVEKIKEGDLLRLSTNNAVLGKIVGIRKQPAVLLTSTADGKWVASKVPDKYMVYLDVVGQASKSNETLTIGDIPMLVGVEIEVKGPQYALKGVISDIKVK